MGSCEPELRCVSLYVVSGSLHVLRNTGSGLKNKLSQSEGVEVVSLLKSGPSNWHRVIPEYSSIGHMAHSFPKGGDRDSIPVSQRSVKVFVAICNMSQ